MSHPKSLVRRACQQSKGFKSRNDRNLSYGQGCPMRVGIRSLPVGRQGSPMQG
ncbi:MAG: hypothetical protein K9J37_02740 [Saprospiraceae bacterium]|nr:hypothetical protein [Saprospiraceae bacterium]MCF8248798.1 hypothetical protein [Saprospiraceae bacterium]MCF8279911.1 hypothetical protein [Bacteroidales bacterium]MCF8310083.1 hypothetical protein [Saprospiraceae bacterium]MCF8438983.1 hypothetical protein [Saprospiraceae bacterium]